MNKSTEKGLVPELRFPEFKNDAEWEKKVLNNKDIATFVRDREPLEQLKLNSYVSTENLLADYAGVAKASKLPPSGSFTRYKPNDVLISNIRPYLKKVWCADKIGAASNDVIVIRPNAKVSAAYMLHILKNDEFINFVMKGAKGVKMPRGDIASIKAYPVALPRLPEQQKIADCLSSLDELVNAHTQKLTALKAHKKGLLQQLFPAKGETVPKLRFPAFRDQSEWIEFKLIDVVDKNVKWSFIGGPFGSNLKSSDYVEKGIRIIQLQNIGDARFNDTYQIFTSKEKADELLANNIYPGDIIISKMGDPVGRACLIPETHHRYVMCSDGIRLVVNEGLHNKYFIYSLINDTKFRSSIERSATGSTRKRIGLDDLKKLTMLLPKLDEQQEIANLFFSVDTLIAAQIQKIESLKTHKKGLMQQLFPSIDDDHMSAKAKVGAS